ncbi:SsgA family sporulation/cell division regulator [Nonomuraea sp. NPDC001699]
MRIPTAFEHVTLFPSGQPDDRYLGTLYYDGADPYAVSLCYIDNRTEAQLGATFARSMLIDSVDFGRWTGGDRVLVGPHAEAGHSVIAIAADPQVGSRDVTLTCSTKVLQKFVDKTLAAVPLGAEDQWIDWHAELAMLMPDRRRTIAVRQAGGIFDGWGTGLLTAHGFEADSVVVEVPGTVGTPATWTVSRAGLACAAIGARGGWFRLQAPDGGPELLARAADVHAFLAGVGGAAA